MAKAEELEMSKMKLTARLTEAEATIQNLNAKLHQLEKGRHIQGARGRLGFIQEGVEGKDA